MSRQSQEIAQKAADSFCDWLLRMIPKPIREEVKRRLHESFLSVAEQSAKEAQKALLGGQKAADVLAKERK